MRRAPRNLLIRTDFSEVNAMRAAKSLSQVISEEKATPDPFIAAPPGAASTFGGRWLAEWSKLRSARYETVTGPGQTA